MTFFYSIFQNHIAHSSSHIKIDIDVNIDLDVHVFVHEHFLEAEYKKKHFLHHVHFGLSSLVRFLVLTC